MTDLLTLHRLPETESETLGVLSWNGIPFAVSLEHRWRNNERRISGIPFGNYTVIRCRASEVYGYEDSPKFGNTFMVQKVPNRDHILFHKGNTVDDTDGCILIGSEFGYINNQQAVLNAAKAFEKFLKLTEDVDFFDLEILGCG